MRQLQQAKQAFPDVYLIVGVTGDKETHRRKGLTVLSAKERAESVRHCRWVDEVVEDCPWILADCPEFIEKYQIDYVAHDDIPYGAEEGDDIYAPIKEAGKFLVTQRTEGVSTTGIITKYGFRPGVDEVSLTPGQGHPRLRQLHHPTAQARHFPTGTQRLLAEEERARHQAHHGRAAGQHPHQLDDHRPGARQGAAPHLAGHRQPPRESRAHAAGRSHRVAAAPWLAVGLRRGAPEPPRRPQVPDRWILDEHVGFRGGL